MKIIAVIVALLVSVGCFAMPVMASNEDISEHIEVATQYAKAAYASKEVILSFKEDLKAEYDLDLHKLEANISTLGVINKGSHFIIGLQANLVAYCFDAYGLRIRVCMIITIAIGIDKVTKKVVGIQVVQAEALKIIIGWEGPDA